MPREDPRQRRPDGSFPDDQCSIGGKPYSIVKRQMVRRPTRVPVYGKDGALLGHTDEERDMYVVGTLVPR